MGGSKPDLPRLLQCAPCTQSSNPGFSSAKPRRKCAPSAIARSAPSPSRLLPTEGACFNDELQRLPTGNRSLIPKGIYHFKSHEDANRFDLECLVKGMAEMARERS